MHLARLLTDRAAQDNGRLFVSLALRADGSWQAAHRGRSEGYSVAVDADPLRALCAAMCVPLPDDDPCEALL